MPFSRNMRITVVSSVLLIISVLVAVFFIRAPILVVSNTMLTEMYGLKRVNATRIRLAIESFRPVHIIDLAPDASFDFAVHAAVLYSDKPHAVVFPSWLETAALQYAKLKPAVSVLLIGVQELSGENPGNILMYASDHDLDLQRASRAAQYLLSTMSEPPYIQFGAYSAKFNTVALAKEQWIVLDSASMEGLADSGAIILFSWMDTALCSEQTVLVFDDSLYGLLPDVLKAFRKGRKQILVASRLFFPNSPLLKGRQRESFKRILKKS